MGELVCVTGAGGFLGSWLVKLLLSKGYSVHATLRQQPDYEQHAFLYQMGNAAAQNLNLFKADLFDYDALCTAIKGCSGVFHVASPVPSSTVPDPQLQLIDPAVKGTLNVLNASRVSNVKRVVIVSSIASIVMNPSWSKDQLIDESSWSDKDYCRTTNNWYCLSKTEAEFQAFQYAKLHHLDIVSVCPSLILGPILHSKDNASTLMLIKLLKEGSESVENKMRRIVDVRDVSEALILTYEKAEAQGRYICSAHEIKARDLVNLLKTMYPNYSYPKSYSREVEADYKLSREKLQKLGWSYKALKETLVDSVESYIEAGFLDKC